MGRSRLRSRSRPSSQRACLFATATVPSPTPAMKFAEESKSLAAAHGYSDFEQWLTAGGDDRSLIKPTGANKYHIKPQPIEAGAVFRGSCTGNPPTQRGYDAAVALYDGTLGPVADDQAKLDEALSAVFQDQRARLTAILELPPGAEVILCPSGSDAEYIPLAIARALKGPSANISNGITQLREIGAGSAPAALGSYFSTHAPLVGKLKDAAGAVAGFEGVTGVEIPARNRDGTKVDAAGEMSSFAKAELEAGRYPIVHGVFGGKTGMRDEAMPGSASGGVETLGIVDACQGRFTQEELQQWLAQDSVVLFTSSKFYQAPPFCAAVIVPSNIAAKLRTSPAPEPFAMFGEDGLGGFITDKELPSSLAENWGPKLRRFGANNIGLALRWEAGLAGMEALAATGKDDAARTAAVGVWNSTVAGMVDAEPHLDAWSVERSIISIRVSKSAGGDEWRSMSELRELYRWMSLDVSAAAPDATAAEKKALSKPAYIGQPVDVSEGHAIVRIALGVESLISYLTDPDVTVAEDAAAVAKLSAIGKHFDVLAASGM